MRPGGQHGSFSCSTNEPAAAVAHTATTGCMQLQAVVLDCHTRASMPRQQKLSKPGCACKLPTQHTLSAIFPPAMPDLIHRLLSEPHNERHAAVFHRWHNSTASWSCPCRAPLFPTTTDTRCSAAPAETACMPYCHTQEGMPCQRSWASMAAMASAHHGGHIAHPYGVLTSAFSVHRILCRAHMRFHVRVGAGQDLTRGEGRPNSQCTASAAATMGLPSNIRPCSAAAARSAASTDR